MPRDRTDADERARQRQLAQEVAGAIVGHPVTHREAAVIMRGDDPAPLTSNPRRRGPSIRTARTKPTDLADLTQTRVAGILGGDIEAWLFTLAERIRTNDPPLTGLVSQGHSEPDRGV